MYTAKAKRYQAPVYLVLALALALLAGTPFMPEAAASPDEATFYSTAYDGYLVGFDINSYPAAHGASSGTVYEGYNYICVGQMYYPIQGSYDVRRGALFFDTSSLPDDATINSAVLSLNGFLGSGVDFDITVVCGLGLHEPLQEADYGYLGSQNVSGGAFNTSGFKLFVYNDIPLNGTGLGWISKTGTTKFGLRSSKDIAFIAPSGSEYVCVYAFEEHLWPEPRLVVTYTTPVGGEAYPIDKTSVLAPWIAIAVLLTGGISWYALRRHKAHSQDLG